jgi:hypothetical protein
MMTEVRQNDPSNASGGNGDSQLWDQEPNIRMSRHKSGIQRGKSEAVAARELSQPGIRDLFVALNAFVGDILIAEAIINETVLRIGLKVREGLPRCSSAAICGHLHVKAEKGSLCHGTSDDGLNQSAEPSRGTSVVRMVIDEQRHDDIAIKQPAHGSPSASSI